MEQSGGKSGGIKEDVNNASASGTVKRKSPECVEVKVDGQVIEDVLSGISSDDPVLQLAACQRLIEPGVTLPSLLYSLYEAVIEANLVPNILLFLDSENTSLLLAATWVIATLARMEPKLLVDKGALEALIQLLKPDNWGVAEAASYALSALAASSGGNDKRLYVNKLREAGIISIIIETVSSAILQLGQECRDTDVVEPPSLGVIQSFTKLLKAICYVPKNVRVTNDRVVLLPTICDIFMIVEETEVDILYECCWALYYLTKSGNEEIIEQLVEKEVVPKLVSCITASLPERRLLRPCLNVVGNIISSSIDEHTDAVLFAGILQHLQNLMLLPKWTAEVNWIVSNIAAGNVAQKEALYQAGFFDLALQVLNSDVMAGCKEAVFTVLNIMDKGTEAQKSFFRVNNILISLTAVLKQEEQHPEILMPVLDTIHLYVRTFYSADDNVTLLEELNSSGALLELSKFQDDENLEISDRVSYILDVGLNNV